MKRTIIGILLCVVHLLICIEQGAASNTVIVSAEGLVDPNADIYTNNKALMIDDLRSDARKQAIEKVVGIYVDSKSLVENYVLVEDKVLTRSQGLIKKIVKESQPWLGKDGFMHLLIKAEVYTGNTRELLAELSANDRAIKMREAGSPRISVAITVRDAQRDTGLPAVRSDVAENVFKKQMTQYGYRVWSEKAGEDFAQRLEKKNMTKGDEKLAASYGAMMMSDFRIVGSVTFQPIIITMKSSGIKMKKYALNSYTVKCFDAQTGEELYFNSKLPHQKSWVTEDQALVDIGEMISGEFSKDFFADYLITNVSTYHVMVEGLPSYDVGVLFKKELIGLRPVLDVIFRSFDAGGTALYEVKFSGNREHFANSVHSALIGPLNAKLGSDRFSMTGLQGNVVWLQFDGGDDLEQMASTFEESPPSSLANTSAERIADLAQSERSGKQLGKIQENAVQPFEASSATGPSNEITSSIDNF